ncbi:MAG: vitamin B12 dependent methionine synthase [Candidatus Omnitrophica bacterium]|nr:vitamin B12 dependent methionine synthase [Candidatus Omnitrophota bacterium]
MPISHNINVICNGGLFFLNNIPFKVDAVKAAEKLKIPQDSEEYDLILKMAAEAELKGAPKAVYRIEYINGRTEDSVVIGETTFKSRVLTVNLEKAHRVFLYVITCGAELEEWSKNYTDPFFSYFADHIKQSALESAVTFLYDYIKETYGLKKSARMAPGSLKDWPIEEQKPFFKMMGNVKETAGVVLTESFLMLPSKSVSGLLFPTGTAFESCMLCPREKCTGRRAPYNAKLYGKRYQNSTAVFFDRTV